ncbi:Hsp70 family protein [Theileria parva strain Muguga]|uniref:Hsp70 family protein n=1 Tax=Theileria parva strain Muguga TaxID=333668 RepID=UPI001C61A2F5|nr:Hsp70 family protein [Theileria parva strain Muguga]EAN32526.2 Hsp70 family protein [Theileria parva strain Muguga]
MPVLGIDVGSSTSTVATISRGAIDIVLNDVSQRYTPTCVSYGEYQRVFGDQANTQIVSNFKNTCRGFLNVLGLNLNSDKDENWNVTELDKFFSSTPLVVDEKGQLSYQVTNAGKTVNVSAVSALVGYLNYLTDLAEKYTGGVCREVVMSYPSWFSEYQKSLLVASVRACGSNCLRLVSEGFAMAMDYGMYRLKQLNDEKATTVALVNIGHSHTTVAIVDFFATYCVILSELSDRDLGGRYLEYLLMNEMCQEFNKKYNLDPLGNTKTRLKVEATASKVKRVLSANSESSYSLECLMEDYDLNGHLKREEFEVLCSREFLPRLSELLMCSLKVSGRTMESIDSVEVVGGITRVPCVQTLISHVFDKPVSKTLNADESIARGCVLQGAINSKHYMVRKYNVIEKLSRPFTVTFLPGLGPFSQQQMYNAEILTVANVGTNYNEVFTVKVKLDPPFTVFTSFDDPRITSKNQLPTFQYTLSQVQEYTSSPKDKRKENKPEEKKEEGEEGNMSEVEEYLSKVEKELNQEAGRTNQNKGGLDRDADGWAIKFKFDETVNLFSFCRGLDVSVMSPFILETDKLSANESAQKKKDLHETNRLRTLNDLETYVYTVRDKLQTTHKDFMDPKNMNQVIEKLNETENWLYENRTATLESLEKMYNTLTSQFDPVENNYNIYLNKEQNLSSFFSRLSNLHQYSVGTDNSWLNVPENERTSISNKLTMLSSNTMKLVEREKNMPKYNNPLYTMEQLDQELKNVKDEMDKLIKKHKVVEQPKSEPEPEPEPEPSKEPEVTEPEEEQKNDPESQNQEEEMEVDESKSQEEMAK